MDERKLIISSKSLADLHNSLVMLHPTGEDIITVANCIMSLRQMVETSEEVKKDADEQSAI